MVSQAAEISVAQVVDSLADKVLMSVSPIRSVSGVNADVVQRGGIALARTLVSMAGPIVVDARAPPIPLFVEAMRRAVSRSLSCSVSLTRRRDEEPFWGVAVSQKLGWPSPWQLQCWTGIIRGS